LILTIEDLNDYTGGGSDTSARLLNNDADAIEALLYGTGFTMKKMPFVVY
jgi:hypothetical protein